MVQMLRFSIASFCQCHAFFKFYASAHLKDSQFQESIKLMACVCATATAQRSPASVKC